MPITALKFEQTNIDEISNYDDSELTTGTDTNLSVPDSVRYCDQVEEIILIGEKTDIKKLLANQNNQLTNFFVQNFDGNFNATAKEYVNTVIDSAISQINLQDSEAKETLKSDCADDIVDYYKNLEKHLSIVRHEIDKLKSDAYMDLEYINKVLNETSLESDAICKDHLSDSYSNIFDQNTNYEEMFQLNDCHSNQSQTDYADYAPSTDAYSKYESDNTMSLLLNHHKPAVRFQDFIPVF